jgi:hypothetical protein
MNGGIQAGILLMISLMWRCPAHGQEIHIRVLNAHDGKPIANECVNVSFGPWHRGDLIAPTNKDGVMVLHLTSDEVTANPVSPSPCDRTAILGPKSLPKGDDTLAITSDYYVDCQEWAKAIPEEAAKAALNRAPSYRITRIVKSGVAAGNRCGQFREEAKPGELILYVRSLTLAEKMQR